MAKRRRWYWIQSYQQLMDRMALLESMAGLRQSLEEFEAGKGMPLDEAFSQLKQQQDRPD